MLQVEILQDGIDVHGKVCAESVKPLHDHLTSQHDKLRQDSNKYRRELVRDINNHMSLFGHVLIWSKLDSLIRFNLISST